MRSNNKGGGGDDVCGDDHELCEWRKKILTNVWIKSCQWQWEWQEPINQRLSVGLWQKLHKTSESEVLNIIECLSTTAITLSLQLNSSTISDHRGNYNVDEKEQSQQNHSTSKYWFSSRQKDSWVLDDQALKSGAQNSCLLLSHTCLDHLTQEKSWLQQLHTLQEKSQLLMRFVSPPSFIVEE